eukprot:NODE_4147_length_854_cov_10.937888_g3825_i0.p1 GENE.NODE_4147_length_854_cov_10.937888_g3825_i0~~NODE_4147_length_854_cov_10.937888_g3825_i0.p1  ORF type:complete len:268 (-),score=34.04 NODE_4147_length_854_cov_10.937888_g3825_i0:27-830(-)
MDFHECLQGGGERVHVAQRFGWGVQVFDETDQIALACDEAGYVTISPAHKYSLFVPILEPTSTVMELMQSRDDHKPALRIRKTPPMVPKGSLKRMLGDADLRRFIQIDVLRPGDVLYVYLYKAVVDKCVLVPGMVTSTRGYTFSAVSHWLREINRDHNLIPSSKNPWNSWCVILAQRNHGFIVNLNVMNQYVERGEMIDNHENLLDIPPTSDNVTAMKELFPKIVLGKSQYLYWFEPSQPPPDRSDCWEIAKNSHGIPSCPVDLRLD